MSQNCESGCTWIKKASVKSGTKPGSSWVFVLREYKIWFNKIWSSHDGSTSCPSWLRTIRPLSMGVSRIYRGSVGWWPKVMKGGCSHHWASGLMGYWEHLGKELRTLRKTFRGFRQHHPGIMMSQTSGEAF